MENAMKTFFLTILISVFFMFSSCKEEKDNIYENYPDNSENSDEGGCGVVPDQNIEKPDNAINDTNEKPDETVENDMTENDPEVIPDLDSTPDESQETDTDDKVDVDMQDIDITDDSDIDEGLCPPDMVENGEWCIDKYEASKKDATSTLQGSDETIALSKKGVLPWMVNPMTAADYQKFKTACTAAGKRLCRDTEWLYSCKGAELRTYSWGNAYNREICNTVDAYCDEHCEANSIPPESCLTSENCGYSYSCFDVTTTADFENCVNHSGAYDINGNVWEITDDGSGYKIRGGAFNCGNPSSRLECDFNATWPDLFAGFRCCRDKN